MIPNYRMKLRLIRSYTKNFYLNGSYTMKNLLNYLTWLNKKLIKTCLIKTLEKTSSNEKSLCELTLQGFLIFVRRLSMADSSTFYTRDFFLRKLETRATRLKTRVIKSESGTKKSTRSVAISVYSFLIFLCVFFQHLAILKPNFRDYLSDLTQ